MAKGGKEIVLPQVPREIVETGLNLCLNARHNEESLRGIAAEMENNNPDFLQQTLRVSLKTMGMSGREYGPRGAVGYFSGAAFVAFCLDAERKSRQGIDVRQIDGGLLEDRGFDLFNDVMRKKTAEVGRVRLGRRIERENPYINYALGVSAYNGDENEELNWIVVPFFTGALNAYEDYRKPGRKDKPTKRDVLSAVPLVEPPVVRKVLADMIVRPFRFIEEAAADLDSISPTYAESLKNMTEDPHFGDDESFALEISSAFIVRSLVEQAKKTGQKLPNTRRLLNFGQGIRLGLSEEGPEGLFNLPMEMTTENPHLARVAGDFVSSFDKTDREQGNVLLGTYGVYKDLRSLFVD